MKTKDWIAIGVLAGSILAVCAAFAPTMIGHAGETIAESRAERIEREETRKEKRRRYAEAEARVNKARALSKEWREDAVSFATQHACGVIREAISAGGIALRGNRYYVLPLFWQMMPGPNKHNFLEYLSAYNGEAGGTRTVEVYDGQTGRKLGYYSPRTGSATY